MKRLGIFSFYDRDGIVDLYIKYLLDELMTVLDRLVVVVNGQINDAGKQFFEQYTDTLIVRENKGFDAGAYADVILNVLGDSVRGWDEVVLCNDTFFGPFVPMVSIFKEMEQKKVDFWGLNYVNRKMLRYIQSYFLVFRSQIVRSGTLTQFFLTQIDPAELDVRDIYGKFEKGIFHYLIERQYAYASYCDTELCCIYESPDVCIAEYGLPILKKRSFCKDFDNGKAAINAVHYLEQRTDYDTNCILLSVKRLHELSWEPGDLLSYQTPSRNDAVRIAACAYYEKELETLIGDRTFYIYGTGLIAHKIYYVCLHRCKGLKGFVVSDTEDIKKPVVCGYPVFHYGEIDSKDLIVLGVNKELTGEIQQNLAEGSEFIVLWE